MCSVPGNVAYYCFIYCYTFYLRGFFLDTNYFVMFLAFVAYVVDFTLPMGVTAIMDCDSSSLSYELISFAVVVYKNSYYFA